jgi:Sigma-54 interaction domain/Inner membrane component of T3SS, cytoplasmic domain
MTDFVLDETERASFARGITEQPRSVRLQVVEGPARGKHAIVSQMGRIGSARGNALEVEDPTVSRVHCEIALEEIGIVLRDLGSRNGTLVSGVMIKEGCIPTGTVLQLGRTTVRIESTDEAAHTELSARTSFGGLLGDSPQMRAVYAVLERVSASDATLLIEGETGTGKDVAARAVHMHSTRSRGTFVPVDCGAIPEHRTREPRSNHLGASETRPRNACYRGQLARHAAIRIISGRRANRVRARQMPSRVGWRRHRTRARYDRKRRQPRSYGTLRAWPRHGRTTLCRRRWQDNRRAVWCGCGTRTGRARTAAPASFE